MFTITETARLSLHQFQSETGDCTGLRLVIHGDFPGNYQPALLPVAPTDLTPEDRRYDFDGLAVYLDPACVQKANRLEIDLIQTEKGPRLKFDFPSPVWKDPLAKKLQRLIDEKINPGLMTHGGFVSLLKVKNGVAEITMGGGCQGCPLSAMTLNQGVEAIIRRELPEIKSVLDKTDHARGIDPFYKPSGERKSSRSARRRENRKR
jgi:Fe/S biogenesis protein NfuA